MYLLFFLARGPCDVLGAKSPSPFYPQILYKLLWMDWKSFGALFISKLQGASLLDTFYIFMTQRNYRWAFCPTRGIKDPT